jgi:hypothetical protein
MGKTLFARAENEPRHTDGQSRLTSPDQPFCGFRRRPFSACAQTDMEMLNIDIFLFSLWLASIT